MSSLASVWSDIKDTLFPAVAFADEPESDVDEDVAENEAEEQPSTETADPEDAEEESGDDNEEAEAEDDEDEDEDDEDDDDDDEEEFVDPLDALRTKYSEGVCHPFKHHFDECVERVTKAQEEPGYEDLEYKEDCIEEFFHLQHCLDDNTSRVLFAKLK